MNIEWRDVPGFEGRYEVSAAGQIRRMAREVTRQDGRPYSVRAKLLKTFAHPGGYRQTCLRANCGVNGRMFYVHRIVALAFLPNPDGLPEVNHINLDKADNCAANLEWVTARANNTHAKANGLFHGRTNARQRVKLTPDMADTIKQTAGSSRLIGEQFGVSSAMVLHIRNDRRWQHPAEKDAWR